MRDIKGPLLEGASASNSQAMAHASAEPEANSLALAREPLPYGLGPS